MANKASNHIVRCNIATCEAHNDRTEEYMKQIKKEDLYIIQECTPHNIHWRSGQMQDMKLEEYMQSLRELYKSKWGYYANENDRTMVIKERD